MGRPTKYTPKLSAEICERLAAGETLRSICRDPGMPRESTVRNWALDEGHPFFAHYARARTVGYHRMADDLLHIADDSSRDMRTVIRGDEALSVPDTDVVNRSRLRVDTRKWLLSKALPKIYGDKLDVTSDGKPIIQLVSFSSPKGEKGE